MAQPINKDTLRKLRESKNFDQKDLAKLTGLRNDSISRMERGEQTGASAKTQAKLAKALGVEPEALILEFDPINQISASAKTEEKQAQKAKARLAKFLGVDPITKDTLRRKLRESKDFDQKDLAKLTGLRNDSISRMERGEQTGASTKTQAKPAKALGVEPEALTREIDIPKPNPVDEQSFINRRVTFSRSEWRAWEAVSVGYGVSWLKVLKFAPALFAICAEQSLRQRAADLDAMEARAQELTAAGKRLIHLGVQRLPRYELSRMIKAEKDSIENRDIFAQNTLDEIDFDLDDDDLPRDPENPDAIANPFIAFVRESANGVGLTFERERLDPDECSLGLEDRWFDAITGGDEKLNEELAVSGIFLQDIPRELMMKDRLEDRKSWLRDRMETDPYLVAQQKAMESLIEELLAMPADPSSEITGESADV